MTSNQLIKANIETLLKARGQKRAELARWCRRTPAWLTKIFQEERREFPTKYLTRIASFFGIEVYQLFQPGISPLTERRAGFDRRKVRDRRISQAILSERPGDVDAIHLMRAMSQTGRQKLIAFAVDIVNDELREPPARAAVAAAPDRTAETRRARRART